MRPLRLATWNVAWFARLFDRHDRLMADAAASAMPGVSRARQAEAIATVLARLDADLLAVIEAPNRGRVRSILFMGPDPRPARRPGQCSGRS